MRLSQLIESAAINDFEPEIESLLTAAAAMNVTELTTQVLLNDLEKLGYTVDVTTLLQVLDNVPMVSSANKKTINLQAPDPETMKGMDADEIERGRVDRMAKKQAKKDMGESFDELRLLAGIRRTI